MASMFNILCLSLITRSMLEHTIAKAAMKSGGSEVFLMQSEGLNEYLGWPFLVLTMVNKEQRSRTIPS